MRPLRLPTGMQRVVRLLRPDAGWVLAIVPLSPKLRDQSNPERRAPTPDLLLPERLRAGHSDFDVPPTTSGKTVLFVGILKETERGTLRARRARQAPDFFTRERARTAQALPRRCV